MAVDSPFRRDRRKVRSRYRPLLEALERRDLLAGDTVNHPPLAADDLLTTTQGKPLFITSASLLANDSDADGDALKVTLVAGGGPGHGALTLSSSGDFYYVPKPDFSGSDSFQYFAWDGQAFSAAATVTINVTPVSFPPEARNDYYSALVNTKLIVAAPGVLANDGWLYPSPTAQPQPILQPPSGQGLQAQLVGNPAHGAVTLNADGSFSYVPNPDFTGLDTFTYRDASISATPLPGTTATELSPVAGNVATVTIAVKPLNPGPEAHNDYYPVAENATLAVAAPGVLANDSGLTNQPLIVVLVSGPRSGSLTLSPSGSFVYAPAKNFFGVDQFVYRASNTPPDSLGPIGSAPITLGSIATVSVSVIPTNLPPEAHNDTYSTTQGVALSIAAPGVLANDSGPAGDTLNAALLTNPAHGSLAFQPDGSFVYLPKGDFFGLDYFTYRATDVTAPSGNTTPGSGALTTTGDSGATPLPPIRRDVATVAVYVKPLNLPPIAINDTYSTPQGATLTIAAPGVLTNDKPPAGQKLTATVLTNPAHGSLAFNPDGSFTYAPNGDFTGIDTFTYQDQVQAATATSDIGSPTNPTDPSNGNTVPVVPNVATVAIFVRSLNPSPEAHNDTYSTTQGIPLNVAAPGVLANDGGPAGQKLAATLLAKPTHGSVAFNADGSFSYAPTGDFTGFDTFSYRAVGVTPPATTAAPGTNDGTNPLPQPVPPATSDVATVYILVKPLNPPPAAHNDTYNTLVGTELDVAAPGVLGNDLAANGHPLTAKLLHGPGHGAVTLNADGSFSYVPSPDFTGADVFAYQAIDSSISGSGSTASGTLAASDNNASPLPGSPSPQPIATDIAYVTIYVMPNKPLVEAHDDTYVTPKNGALEITAPGVLANDLGPAGTVLTAAVITQPAHGVLTLNSDGSFRYQPAADFLGDDKFTYRASVGSAASPPANTTGSIATVTIYVLPTDPLVPFVLGSDEQRDQHTTDESGPQRIPGYATPLIASGDAQPSFIVSTDNPRLFSTPPAIDGSGQLAYAPAPNASGASTVAVKLNGGGTDASYSQTFTIYVDKPHLLHDAALPCDVGGDHAIAPDDALLVINYLNSNLPTKVTSADPLVSGATRLFYDVDADNSITATDALLIINWLNAQPLVPNPKAEGEASDVSVAPKDSSATANLGISQLLVATTTAVRADAQLTSPATVQPLSFALAPAAAAELNQEPALSQTSPAETTATVATHAAGNRSEDLLPLLSDELLDVLASARLAS